MKILMVGGGKAGAWQMRGVQLGAALGARVTSTPTIADFTWADVIVLVKRAILQFGREARRSGKFIVWDALDFWGQPAQNCLNESAAIVAAMEHRQRFDLVIGATQAMAAALDGVYLPHHSWSGLTPMPARRAVWTVAYQGGAVFLGRWKVAIERECARRGWTFVINPPDLSEADILVAFRDGPWDGWICREWKSGVKIVNAIAAGRPIITQGSAAYRELRPAGTIIERVADLSKAFDDWTYAARLRAFEDNAMLAPAYRVEAIAPLYSGVIQSSLRAVA